jgi:16S rRNA (guanine966-N2)-methyltransferase
VSTIRIVGGRAGGRRIEVPPGRNTRPTTEQVREALFAALEARGAVAGARTLDLFAGSGALGLEAASRGAASVVLVEAARPVAGLARRNAASLAASGLGPVQVVGSSAERYLGAPPPAPYDLVLLDPPYSLVEAGLRDVLAALARPGWLAPEGVVVVERSMRSPEPGWPVEWERIWHRRYGETAVWVAARRPADAAPSRC